MKRIFAILALLLLSSLPTHQAHASFTDTQFMQNALAWGKSTVTNGSGTQFTGGSYTGPASNCPSTFYSNADWTSSTNYWKIKIGNSCNRNANGSLAYVVVKVYFKPTTWQWYADYHCWDSSGGQGTSMLCSWQ